ncbi:hypothetical protein ACFYSC_22495 [Streptosporangium sp. NPDC004379]|uniref:hypothetical protein n=1 Tax=Streptosporangium sp. NPDC004379 TaxID=3366189 RepID=UPI00368E94C4
MTIRHTLFTGTVLASLLAVPAAGAAMAGTASAGSAVRAAPVTAPALTRDDGTCPSRRKASRCIRHRGFSAVSYGPGLDRPRPPKEKRGRPPKPPGIGYGDNLQPGGPGGPGGIND